jgi:glycosyltransferase involved in cell wall biosynthesis
VRDLIAQLGLDGAVEMMGPLDRESALAHLRRARLMVFPSLWEGLPIAPMEALYFGVPVVASNIPGTDEVVTDGRNGLLVDKPTPESLAAAIRRLVIDQAEWTRLSLNGKADAAARFDRGLNSSAHIELYGKLIGQRPGT